MKHLLPVSIALALLFASSCGGNSSPAPKPGATDTPLAADVPSLTLAPALGSEGVTPGNLERARAVLEQRLLQYGVAGVEVVVARDDIKVFGPPIDPALANAVSRAGQLMACQPIVNSENLVAVVVGQVNYRPLSCDPRRDDQGNVLTNIGTIEFAPLEPDTFISGAAGIVWEPVTMDSADGLLILPGSQVVSARATTDSAGRATVEIQLTPEAATAFRETETSLVEDGFTSVFFLDGAPLRDQGGSIPVPTSDSDTVALIGLSRQEAELIAGYLNSGALPFAMRVVTQ